MTRVKSRVHNTRIEELEKAEASYSIIINLTRVSLKRSTSIELNRFQGMLKDLTDLEARFVT